MEHYKLPAGRLATIFYKTEPRRLKTETDSCGSDQEKGSMNPDVPPMPTSTHTHSVSDHNGRTLAWKNLTLELKTGSGMTRLLDNLSG